MPCRSDYMEPNAREAESKLVCQLLKYVFKAANIQPTQSVIDRVEVGIKEVYGNPNFLDADTDLLCQLLRNMDGNEEQRIVYDGRNADARKLAEWWEHHQEADRKREANEAKQRVVKQHARKPISPADLRKLTEAAVARGQQEHEDELVRIAEEQKREQRKAELEAEGVIMQIPSKCEKEARSQRSHAIVMGLKYNKHHDQIGGNVLDVAKLKGAGKIVYQYCKDAELNPTLEYWWSGDGMDSGYNIVVRW